MNELLDYAGADGYNLTTLKLERAPRRVIISDYHVNIPDINTLSGLLNEHKLRALIYEKEIQSTSNCQ